MGGDRVNGDYYWSKALWQLKSLASEKVVGIHKTPPTQHCEHAGSGCGWELA